MDIYKQALALAKANRPYAIGLIVNAQGSTPQKTGCKALVDDQGGQWGTLGGGLVEAEGLERMRRVIEGMAPDLFEFRLDESYSRAAGPICGGVMRIFANPHGAQNAAAFEAAVNALNRRERGALVSILSGEKSGSVLWINEAELNGTWNGYDAAQLRETITAERATALSGAGLHEIFIEPVIAPPRMLVVGGGHVGQEVVRQGVALGFDVTVIDDREEYARPELFPAEARAAHGDIKTLVSDFPQDHETFIVLVSKGHRPDAEALEGCIHGASNYIGMIGSKRKIRFLRKHFIEDGVSTEAEFDRVVAPIGFEIGAITVPEIGVSIAAQLIAARRLGRTICRAMNESR